MKTLTKSEHATTLFALRYLRENLHQANDLMQDSGYFEECDALTKYEIDELCKRLTHDLPVATNNGH